MQIHQIEQKTPEWLELRKGKVTGTGLKRILGTKTTRDTYLVEMLAERLSVGDDEENALERGERLEHEAREAFEKATGKIVEEVGFCTSDTNPLIANSPDGLIKNGGKYTEAVEIKCLSSANHIKAWLDNEVPKDYYPQVVQYFIVNDDLQTLYLVLYDPRITVQPLHIIEVHREAILSDIDTSRRMQEQFLAEVEEKLAGLIADTF